MALIRSNRAPPHAFEHYPAFFDRTGVCNGFSAFFGACPFGSSLAARLPLIGNSISRWPAAALRGFLPLVFGAGSGRGSGLSLAGGALLQGIHEVHDVLALRAGLRGDGLPLRLR